MICFPFVPFFDFQDIRGLFDISGDSDAFKKATFGTAQVFAQLPFGKI